MIRVMVVDDSPLVRKIVSDILNSDPQIQVTATAARAEFALGKLERESPDVITMDIEMPGMGGLPAIGEIMRRRPTPIVVLSAHAQKGTELTLQALEAGAVDFVSKPFASPIRSIDLVAQELLEKVRGAAGIRFHVPQPPPRPQPVRHPQRKPTGGGPARAAAARRNGYELVAIGTSTGGPVALKTVLSGLPAGFPLPIVVVQHMPPVFTRAFAERLNATCALRVKEAENGDRLLPATVLIAPGDYHLTVSSQGAEPRVQLNRQEPVCGHRPSVDVLMRSVAREYGGRAIGVIMTGMGKDGAAGVHELHRQGAPIIAQDADTSVIYGMNREVILAGDADEILPVDRIAASLQSKTRGKE